MVVARALFLLREKTVLHGITVEESNVKKSIYLAGRGIFGRESITQLGFPMRKRNTL
jgi:hypothetical protein